MKVINLVQGSEEWLLWRAEGVTATDVIVLLNRSPYKTPWRAWAEKTGYAKEVDLDMNPLVREGRKNEDLARQAMEERLQDILLPVCIEHSSHSILRASLDGLTSSKKPVELKCPSQAVWDQVRAEGTNSLAYRMYYCQVQHQLLVTEADEGWLAFYYEGQLEVFLIKKDDQMHQDIVKVAYDFWDSVVNRKEPAKNPERDLYIPVDDEAQRWIEAATQYRFFDAEIKELQARMKMLEEKRQPYLESMKSMMGEYLHADFCGVMVTRYFQNGKVDYQRLLSDKANNITADDIEQYRGKKSERCRVTVTDSVKPRYIVDEDVVAPLRDVPERVESFYW